MYYIMEKYNSDTQGTILRSISDWFSEDAYETAISNLEFKTLKEARKALVALKLIFNNRVSCSKLIVLAETKADRYHYEAKETKPKDVTPENINFISDDELRKRIINGQLDDPRLETTLFPKGRPSK